MSYDIAFQAKVLLYVRQAVVSALSTTFGGRVYWQLAPQDATYPLCVFQASDGGGKRADTIGANGWEGLLTLRVMSDDPDEADATLALLPALLQRQTVDGYNLGCVLGRPLAVPPELLPAGAVYTAAVVCNCALTL